MLSNLNARSLVLGANYRCDPKEKVTRDSLSSLIAVRNRQVVRSASAVRKKMFRTATSNSTSPKSTLRVSERCVRIFRDSHPIAELRSGLLFWLIKRVELTKPQIAGCA